MRLIDADELRSGLFHLEGETNITDRQLGYQAGWNDALMYGVLDAPTVDAVKHGHWDNKQIPYDAPHTIARCSNCKGKVVVYAEDYIVNYPYCPLCGAKMDEERREDETD